MGRFIEKIELPFTDHCKRGYPESVLASFDRTDFPLKEITIFYGSNGSGKSTLLNLIANRIGCERRTKFDPVVRVDRESGEVISVFDEISSEILVTYQDSLSYRPTVQKLITSADVFDVVNSNINQNCKVAGQMSDQEQKYRSWQWGDDENAQYLRRHYEREAYARNFAWRTRDIRSNGQEALDYLDAQIEKGGLYLIDEPENCLSPIFQQDLAQIIAESSRYCGCQFILSTHSPFFLSLENAQIYNLDHCPVTDYEEWYELDNMKPYFDLFSKYLD